MTGSSPLLSLDAVHAHYGKSHILHGVSFHVDRNEVVSLLGRNGVGRSTTVKAIRGEVPPHGTIRFKGQPGEQATMFFRDPSGNAIEMKAFADRSKLFATA